MQKKKKLIKYIIRLQMPSKYSKSLMKQIINDYKDLRKENLKLPVYKKGDSFAKIVKILINNGYNEYKYCTGKKSKLEEIYKKIYPNNPVPQYYKKLQEEIFNHYVNEKKVVYQDPMDFLKQKIKSKIPKERKIPKKRLHIKSIPEKSLSIKKRKIPKKRLQVKSIMDNIKSIPEKSPSIKTLSPQKQKVIKNTFENIVAPAVVETLNDGRKKSKLFDKVVEELKHKSIKDLKPIAKASAEITGIKIPKKIPNEKTKRSNLWSALAFVSVLGIGTMIAKNINKPSPFQPEYQGGTNLTNMNDFKDFGANLNATVNTSAFKDLSVDFNNAIKAEPAEPFQMEIDFPGIADINQQQEYNEALNKDFFNMMKNQGDAKALQEIAREQHEKQLEKQKDIEGIKIIKQKIKEDDYKRGRDKQLKFEKIYEKAKQKREKALQKQKEKIESKMKKYYDTALKNVKDQKKYENALERDFVKMMKHQGDAKLLQKIAREQHEKQKDREGIEIIKEKIKKSDYTRGTIKQKEFEKIYEKVKKQHEKAQKKRKIRKQMKEEKNIFKELQNKKYKKQILIDKQDTNLKNTKKKLYNLLKNKLNALNENDKKSANLLKELLNDLN